MAGLEVWSHARPDANGFYWLGAMAYPAMAVAVAEGAIVGPVTEAGSCTSSHGEVGEAERESDDLWGGEKEKEIVMG